MSSKELFSPKPSATAQGTWKYKCFLLHFLACFFFLLLPVLYAEGPKGDHQYFNEIVEYILTIGFFYLNYFYLIPRFYFKGRYFIFTCLALIGFIVVSVLPEMLDVGTYVAFPGPSPDAHPFPPPPSGNGKIPFTNMSWNQLGPLDQNFFKYSAAFILAITLRISGRLRKIEQEKAEAELMFLKAQINPHFLFNTLNSIYTLAIEAAADNTAKAIVQLSAMMRYATNDALMGEVSLSKELDYIHNYITLQRLRLNEHVQLFYTVEGNPEGKSIVPFLLIPFIENAFKFGVSTDDDVDIHIKISISDKTLNLSVTNRKVHISTDLQSGTSVGIKNTRNRLDLLYPGRHQLTINDTEGFFEVLMEIEL